MKWQSWSEINDQIRDCLAKPDPLPYLENLFDQTMGDGMVTFTLGQQYEKGGKFHRALMFYREAEAKFPLEEWKQKARERYQTLQKLLLKEG